MYIRILMRYVWTLLLSLLLLVFMTGCAQKQPFKEAKAIENTALVYIYRLSSHGLDDVKYRLYAGNEKIDYMLGGGEYAPVHIKSGAVSIRAVANGVLEHTLDLNLEAPNSYFVKLTPKEGGDFTIEAMTNIQGLTDLKKTFLSGSELEIDPLKKKVVEEKEETVTQHLSISDEIAKLYEMKERGIITQEEFTALKAKVIAK